MKKDDHLQGTASGSCGVGFVCNTQGVRSHHIVQLGVEAVKNLTHRGAVGADGKTGDGAGILIELPKKFFLKYILDCGLKISHEDNLAVGSFFLYEGYEKEIEDIVTEFGLRVICWRDVPTDDDALGESALSSKPMIRQLLLDTVDIEDNKKEVMLYLVRRAIEKRCGSNIYVSSLSSKTISYKGMLVAPQLDRFYPDLNRSDFESAFCMFHQRFSTNTLPEWNLAQPLRVLAHNGEINTIQGNRNWIMTIENEIAHEIFGKHNDLIKPVVSYEESDSASLDKVVELLMLSGRCLEHAILICIPPAWENSEMNETEKAFFEYNSLLMKPWDGPAAVVLTDGDKIVAHLDRNGLRPLRYSLTRDGIFIIGSETGLIELGGKEIKEKGRLGPGEIVSIDMKKGDIRFTDEIIKRLSRNRDYRAMLDRHLFRVKETISLPDIGPEITRRQIAFGYTSEEIKNQIKHMAEKGDEMTFSMGDDTPIPPLSEKPQLLFRYFRQRFSQVTNPPIDPIRERIALSLKMNLGYKRNFLYETPEHARRLHLENPLLFKSHLEEIEKQHVFSIKRIDITYPVGDDILTALERLQEEVVESVIKGTEIIILSDRDVSKDRVAIPSLLSASHCFKNLQRKGIANRASIIVETGEARDAHHMACLIGYGASAIYPYLAFETIKQLCDNGDLIIPYEEAATNYRNALNKGLLKVISRMGISTLNSYYAAQLFDSICLNQDFVDKYFTGTPVVIEADGIAEIKESSMKRHQAAFGHEEPVLDLGGDLRHRKDGQWHAWSTTSVISLNKFIKSMDYKDYKEFSRIANERPVFIRHLLDYKRAEQPLNLEEVEGEEHILKRFFSGAMSIGALSPEAHETIAEACNRLGIRSNSGEGGEDPKRYGTLKNSAIKQVASGRFGVTPAYLASALEIEIKMAQGAKPGEGGHLPANKVTEYIAMLRHCAPNTLLISSPPHHDIYSIEDLTQLINDLKEANPDAKICVKLVAETGVGIVAAGVAKAYADIVQICGCEGGTGAASITSIKNAGNYWEIGLSETQQVLIGNDLRKRIKVRVDGGIRSGRDVVIATLLGAEEYGFGTATMVAAGCVMARQCHLNTCPKGITTQDERLRKKFTGTVESVMAYFKAVARETREILAEMGVKSIDDIIGRTDLLTMRDLPGYEGAKRVKLNRLLKLYPEQVQRKCIWKCNNNPSVSSLNEKILTDILPFIERAEPVERIYRIRNVDRSIPVRLNYHIAKRYGDKGLPEDTIKLTFFGTAGQSFGAFNHNGLTLKLIGDSNDYAGKGMFGGRIIIKNENPHHVIAGNTCLYGATGGEFYASGRVGERFAVRNSGAIAVIEGAGHHLCEYMTMGKVVVLGNVGYNVGAGMTGGVIYIFDESDNLQNRIDKSYVRIRYVDEPEDVHELKVLIGRYQEYTGSIKAKEILENFNLVLRYFKKVLPL